MYTRASFRIVGKGKTVDWIVFFSEQIVLVTLLAVLISALFVVESRKGGKALGHYELTRLLNAEDAVLLDVRDDKEFKAGHITGAIGIPFTKLGKQIDQLNKHKAKTIVVADKMGQHSGAAVKTLQDAGYTAQRLKGGMSEWLAQNLPVVKS